MSTQQKLEKMVEELSSLTVLELANLKKLLEEKWDVKAAAPMAVAVAGPAVGGASAAAEEESTEFNVTLSGVDDSKKIAIIKAVREVTGLGLKEAKDIVDGAPKELKAAASKAEAADIKKKLEEAGAKVTVKGV